MKWTEFFGLWVLCFLWGLLLVLTIGAFVYALTALMVAFSGLVLPFIVVAFLSMLAAAYLTTD